jgi:hypothetical protein
MLRSTQRVVSGNRFTILIIKIVRIKIIDIKKISIQIAIKIIIIKYFIIIARSQNVIICKKFRNRFLLISRVFSSGQIIIKTFKIKIRIIIIRIIVTTFVLKIRGEIRIEKFRYISLKKIKNIQTNFPTIKFSTTIKI